MKIAIRGMVYKVWLFWGQSSCIFYKANELLTDDTSLILPCLVLIAFARWTIDLRQHPAPTGDAEDSTSTVSKVTWRLSPCPLTMQLHLELAACISSGLQLREEVLQSWLLLSQLKVLLLFTCSVALVGQGLHAVSWTRHLWNITCKQQLLTRSKAQ